jgi:hypothetical protein
VDAHTFTKQAEKVSTNAVCKKLMAPIFGDGKGVLMVKFMQQGTTITSQVYCVRNTKKKTAYSHSEQETRNADIRLSAPP